jgi:hypothetical protein
VLVVPPAFAVYMASIRYNGRPRHPYDGVPSLRVRRADTPDEADSPLEPHRLSPTDGSLEELKGVLVFVHVFGRASYLVCGL